MNDEMDTKQGESILSRYGWLSRTPAEFRRAILRISSWHYYKPGAQIMMAGDQPEGPFGIADGTVGLATRFGAPDSPVLHFARRGHWGGEGAVLSDKPRTLSAIAVTEAFVARTSLSSLRKLLSTHPGWWRHIGQLSSANCDLAINVVADMAIRDSTQRCAALILRLCDCRFRDGPDPSREIVVTQDEFALMANLSRATVNSVLRRFAQKRLISVNRRSIFVSRTHDLRRIADGESGQ